MLIVGADLRRIPGDTLTKNDTGVVLTLDLPAYLKNILQLLPETKNEVVRCRQFSRRTLLDWGTAS